MDAEFLKIVRLSEDEAREVIEGIRWANGVYCPKCGSLKGAWKLESKPNSKNKVRPGLYKCKDCRKTFTVTVGSIFEDSHIPLTKWLAALYLMCASNKGMSAHQLHRQLKVTYKTAWFMAHRIRLAMKEGPLATKLSGTVEVDETYIGGRRRGKRGRGSENKTPVVALVQRGGQLRAQKISRLTAGDLKSVIREHVGQEAHLRTDDFLAYRGLDKEFASHETVAHGKKEYVRGDVNTNTLEGWFSLLKRGVNGTFHHVSEIHLDRYIDEFAFRYNQRHVTDGQRTFAAIKSAEGKRLIYKETTK
ncbi:MAG: IS1595 family transposase [Anaerolineales bacterium]